MAAPRQPSIKEKFLASPATWIISAANIIVFLVAESYGPTTNTDILLRFGASERSHVWSGEYWRFVTPMFLHIGAIHLLLNTYILFGWCRQVERAVGTWRFVLAYLATGIAATAVSLLFHDVIAAGASGAGFGIVGVTLVLLYRRLGSWEAFISNPGVKTTLFFVSIWLFIGFTALPMMDNWAHLGGLIFGFAFGWIYSLRRKQFAFLPILSVFLATTVVLAAYPWFGQTARLQGYTTFSAANRAIGSGDMEKALRLFNLAEKQGFTIPELYFNRGLVYARMEKFDRARADIQKALEIAPEDWQYRERAKKALKELEP